MSRRHPVRDDMRLTERVVIDQAVRARREAAALRYLDRKGYADLVPMLGLGHETCESCGGPVTRPARSRGRCSRRACRTSHPGATR